MANESTNATELANTIRLNGWQRLGIILSVVWMFAVSGYAAYEFTTFPLKPFVSYVGDAGNGYEDDAEPFVFVRIVRRSGPDALSYKERAFFDEQIRNAKTSADRDLL